MTLLKAHSISKWFTFPDKVELIRELSLDVKAEQTVAILGPSGAGKSTLLHILGTLERPSSGTIEIEGVKVTERNSPYLRRTQIGFIFQAFHLLEDYTALENVSMPALIAGRRREPERALWLLDQVGLSEKAHFPTKLLSGGEKQRVAFARALMNDPKILLADEPSGNLDEKNKVKIHELLLTLVKQHKKALICVTHDLSLAHAMECRYTLHQGALTHG